MPLNTIPNKGLTSRGYPSDRITTPMIINGDMSVAQRATSVTGKTSDGYYTCDRWRALISSQGTWSISQASDAPTGQGFTKSNKYDCTTADATPSGTDRVVHSMRFEGNCLQGIKKGTSNAEKTTVSFWVKSNITGTYTLEIYDVDNDRQISKTYTIDSANTWEKKVVVFDADTTGTFDNDSSSSANILWWLGAGPDRSSGTFSTTWSSAVTANRVSPNQVNLASSTSNEWYITGVQWEVGEFDSTTIPSFPFESFESNLRRCERYTRRLGDGIWGKASSTTAMVIQCPFFSPMRATPSISAISSAIKTSDVTAADYTSSAGISSANVNANGARIVVTSFSGLTSANMYILYDNSSYIALIDAEL